MYGGEVQCTVGRYSVRWGGTVYGGGRWEGGAVT